MTAIGYPPSKIALLYPKMEQKMDWGTQCSFFQHKVSGIRDCKKKKEARLRFRRKNHMFII